MVSNEELIKMANEARSLSYSPYSHYRVGAALLTESGKVYIGCNIENAAYTPTVCAERVAFFKAISNGERSFCKMAIVGGPEGSINELCTPCGVCRQVMAEFCKKDFVLVLGTPEKFGEYTLEQMLPYSFSAENL